MTVHIGLISQLSEFRFAVSDPLQSWGALVSLSCCLITSPRHSSPLSAATVEGRRTIPMQTKAHMQTQCKAACSFTYILMCVIQILWLSLLILSIKVGLPVSSSHHSLLCFVPPAYNFLPLHLLFTPVRQLILKAGCPHSLNPRLWGCGTTDKRSFYTDPPHSTHTSVNTQWK